MMGRRLRILGVAAAMGIAGGLAISLPAHATLTVSEGLVGGSGDVDNVIFNTCGLSGGPATTVQGCLNTNHSTLVDFTSNENLVISGGGQAVINADDGSFSTVTINLDDPTLGFGKLQFNLDAIADGSVTFTAVDQFGTVFDFGTFALDGTGQNFFTLDSIDNQVALNFTITTTVGLQNISDLEQVRIGPADITTSVPEPSSLAILGGALFALGLLRRRRRDA